MTEYVSISIELIQNHAIFTIKEHMIIDGCFAVYRHSQAGEEALQTLEEALLVGEVGLLFEFPKLCHELALTISELGGSLDDDTDEHVTTP